MRSRGSRRAGSRAVPGGLTQFPCVTDAFLKLDLPGLHKRGIALLGDLHGSMAQQKRDLIDGYTREEHLDCEGVAEHVRVAAFDLAVRGPDISELEKTTIASLPIGDRALGIPIAAPEEVTEIGFRTGRQILQRLDHEWREWNIHRCSGLCLVEKKAVAVKAVSFEGDGVADAQPAPAH